MTKLKLPFIREDLLNLSAYIPTPISENYQQLTRLDANESPYNLPLELKIKLASFYEEKIETNRYPDGSHLKLKNLIANYVNETVNLPQLIDNHNISMGNGSDELIRSILIATCLNNKGSVLVANPTFSMYGILAQSLGIITHTIARNDIDFSWNLDLANEVINNQNNPPVKVIFMVHPNSPTANVLNADEIKWLKNLPSDILVVIDEAYYEFSQQTLVSELPNHFNWLILRTFSKAFRLAAHRVGYAIASSDIIKILEKIRLPYNLPTFSQLATELVLENRDIILPSVKEVMKEKERVYQALIKNPLFKVWKSDANFIYLRLTNNPTSENHNYFMEQLKDNNIIIRHTGNGLRISIGTVAENDYLLSKITKITDKI
ncbi:MAG: histidinol-phosphate transaminase [Cyanobacteria bacterium]|nr:histidinol-phosphate transaminase [Cyanobacteria bacterium CG_2015-16_32_12]NCO76944.1 histidinol-phosphate transaminase [Cyanobacteria bacterium CG_2015-22_32_23]NCQ03829.1 histidinol-phosphate transaminase [Cyanobacteria bacterium CG_2015-09_32_10]NCQ40881.1 histidinol-phosphate transaminase [Cyanobacteria bacterium CG_2015-04_32_10]NCS84978.1 histidinol-phosphate transaminase [Cyanobacteria bacterium CG_2015-02_32_10]